MAPRDKSGHLWRVAAVVVLVLVDILELLIMSQSLLQLIEIMELKMFKYRHIIITMHLHSIFLLCLEIKPTVSVLSVAIYDFRKYKLMLILAFCNHDQKIVN